MINMRPVQQILGRLEDNIQQLAERALEVLMCRISIGQDRRSRQNISSNSLVQALVAMAACRMLLVGQQAASRDRHTVLPINRLAASMRTLSAVSVMRRKCKVLVQALPRQALVLAPLSTTSKRKRGSRPCRIRASRASADTLAI